MCDEKMDFLGSCPGYAVLRCDSIFQGRRNDGCENQAPNRGENADSIYHNHNMVWANGDAAHVISAYFIASIISGEPRIDEESLELRFFGLEEMPPLFAEDHRTALEAYFAGVRYPLLRENSYQSNVVGTE